MIETAREGTLLGGRVRFTQPAEGYRAAIDPIFLAAACPADARMALDLGCGAGAASLALMARVPETHVTGVEIDAGLAALAQTNAAANGWQARFKVETADAAVHSGTGFDLVLCNPPYLDAARADPSPDPASRRADVEDTLALEGWVDAALRALKPRGTLVFIQRADRLADLLGALAGRAGETVVFPLWPRAGVPAKRIIVRARKGVRTPLVLAAGLVLHEADGAYTRAAESILRDGAPLVLV
ncbi:MAG: methyltransferase [Alphaproteobacteria bacterium]|nr:methyltransferase [Alphaproteobacteria bacterium]